MSTVKCNKCKSTIGEPLELFTGELICPKCYGDMTGCSDNVAITEENQELFELSERFFFAGITKKTELLGLRSGEKSDHIIREAEKSFNIALDYCLEAVALGHPGAIYRLGYLYDKDLVAKSDSESSRCRYAAKYYMIAAMDKGQKRNIKGVQGFDTLSDNDKEKLEFLPKQAACDFMRMYSKMSKSDRSFFKAVDVHTMAKIADVTPESADTNMADIIIDALSLKKVVRRVTTNEARYPLFGIFKFPDVATLIEVRNKLSSLESIKSASSNRGSKIRICCGLIKSKTSSLKSAARLDTMLELLDSVIEEKQNDTQGQHMFLIYFVSKDGKRYKESVRSSFAIAWERGDKVKFPHLELLLGDDIPDVITFYDDDIYYATNTKETKEGNFVKSGSSNKLSYRAIEQLAKICKKYMKNK